MATIPESQLQEPARIPRQSRSPESTLDGAGAFAGLLVLLDIAGGFRGELIALRCQVRASQGMTIPAWCPGRD